MNIGRVNNLSFTSMPSKGFVRQDSDNIELSKEMKRLQREDLLKVGQAHRDEALKQLDSQHEALFTALNAQMVQNHFELLNKLDDIEEKIKYVGKKVNEIHWEQVGKYTDPMAPII